MQERRRLKPGLECRVDLLLPTGSEDGIDRSPLARLYRPDQLDPDDLAQAIRLLLEHHSTP